MGVSKVGGGRSGSPPNGWRSLVLGEGGPCRIWRSGGFPKFPGKSSPSSPSPPLFLSLDLFLQFFLPSNASPQLSRAGITPPFLPFPPFYSFSDPFYPLEPSQAPVGPLPNTSGIPPQGLPKAPKRPFLSLFRGTPKTPKKGLKTPFLTPFSPLPYPL